MRSDSSPGLLCVVGCTPPTVLTGALSQQHLVLNLVLNFKMSVKVSFCLVFFCQFDAHTVNVCKHI